MESSIDAPAVSHYNPGGQAPLLLVCEHASNYIPPQLDQLQLADDVLQSHVALDIGALDLARQISDMLDAPLVSSTVSRLVYDCNRSFDIHAAIPEQSEVYRIPGNCDLSVPQMIARYKNYYLPFESAISGLLAQFTGAPLIVTIHSFTPIYQGIERELDIGIICDQDSRLGDQMLKLAQRDSALHVASNQPYGPADQVTHTLQVHGVEKGLLNTMLEIKNDLLDTIEQRANMASILASLISGSAAKFGYDIPLRNTDARRA